MSELENIKLPFGLKIERDLYLNKDCKLIEAMKSSGITPPDFLFSTSNKWKEEKYFDSMIDNIKEMNNTDSYTVAKVSDGVNCVELHYTNGKAMIEYGTRIAEDSWENDIKEVEWFNKDMSISDIEDKLDGLFAEKFGEKDYEL